MTPDHELCFDFDFLNPGKLCAILSTHLSAPQPEPCQSSVSQSKCDASYHSLLLKLRHFYGSCSTCFDSARVDLKLCEIFTATVLAQTQTFVNAESRTFYSPILEILVACKKILTLDTYFQLYHDMDWQFEAAFLICLRADPEFVAIALEKLFSPNLSAHVLLLRCAYFCSKSTTNNQKLANLCITTEYPIADEQEKLRLNLHEAINDIIYHGDFIITLLFKYTKETEEELMHAVDSNKAVYCKLDERVKCLVKKCQELSDLEKFNSDMSNFKDCLVFWNCLVRLVNRKLHCDLPESLEMSLSIPTADKYAFLKKMLTIYQFKQGSLFASHKPHKRRFYAFICKLIYSFMIDSIHYYHDCPLLLSLPCSPKEAFHIDFDSLETLVLRHDFASNILQVDATDNALEQNEFLHLFALTSKLRQLPLETGLDGAVKNRLEHLLAFSFSCALRNRLHDIGFVQKLFTKRLSLYGTDKLPFGATQFGDRLIKEVAFSKLKVDWQSAKIRLLAIDIFFGAFLSPLDTYDNLLNAALIFSPLHYNHFVVHSLSNHLRPLSNSDSFMRDIVSEEKLSLLVSICISKYRQSFDMISIDSLTDFVQSLCHANVVDFETLFANLLAYSDIRAQNCSAHFLQSLLELLKSVHFKSSDLSKYTLITSFLLSLLAYQLADQTKKEIIVATIRTYISKNDSRLSEDQSRRIMHIVQKCAGLSARSIVDDHYLLYYLEDSFGFTLQNHFPLNVRSILLYVSISNQSDWLIEALADHSNHLFDQLYHVFCDILIILTQKELQNLIAFLGKIYSNMEMYLIMLLALATKLEHVDGLTSDSLVYFSRSVFVLLDQLPTELRNQESTNSGKETHLFNHLRYIHFVLISIESRFDSLKNLFQFGSEIHLEVKKMAQSIENEVKLYSHKWNIASNDTNYIDTVKRNFREQIQQYCLLSGLQS